MEFATPDEQGQRSSIESEGWKIEYAVWTSVDAPSEEAPVVIAFHGFARPLEDLYAAHVAWPRPHVMISIHLPHHGQSGPLPASGAADRIIAPSTFNRIIDRIVAREVPMAKDRTLLGYSIGGRIGLALAEERPERWQHVVLLAPDGLKQSPFYAITVHTHLGRWAWFWMDRNEKRVWKWSDALHRSGLISKHLHGFIYFHSSSHAMRMMVWRGWRTHRGCWPNHRAIAAALASIPKTTLVFGEYDKIIPARNANRLKRLTRNQPQIAFHTVRSGHNMLKSETMEAVVQCIFDS